MTDGGMTAAMVRPTVVLSGHRETDCELMGIPAFRAGHVAQL